MFLGQRPTFPAIHNLCFFLKHNPIEEICKVCWGLWHIEDWIFEKLCCSTKKVAWLRVGAESWTLIGVLSLTQDDHCPRRAEAVECWIWRDRASSRMDILNTSQGSLRTSDCRGQVSSLCLALLSHLQQWLQIPALSQKNWPLLTAKVTLLFYKAVTRKCPSTFKIFFRLQAKCILFPNLLCKVNQIHSVQI